MFNHVWCLILTKLRLNEPSTTLFLKIQRKNSSVWRQIPSELDQPALGIICGSGLGGLANSVLPQLCLEITRYLCADIETVAIGSISSPQFLEWKYSRDSRHWRQKVDWLRDYWHCRCPSMCTIDSSFFLGTIRLLSRQIAMSSKLVLISSCLPCIHLANLLSASRNNSLILLAFSNSSWSPGLWVIKGIFTACCGQLYIFILPTETSIWLLHGQNFGHNDFLAVTVEYSRAVKAERAFNDSTDCENSGVWALALFILCWLFGSRIERILMICRSCFTSDLRSVRSRWN